MQLLNGQLPVLESVAHCLQQAWPVLLAGGQGRGATAWFFPFVSHSTKTWLSGTNRNEENLTGQPGVLSKGFSQRSARQCPFERRFVGELSVKAHKVDTAVLASSQVNRTILE